MSTRVAFLLAWFVLLSTAFAAADEGTPPIGRSTVHDVDSVVVERTRASARSAVSFTDLSRSEIEALTYGQDVPMALSSLPSTYAYSDAGNGFGYSYVKIRGFDQNRIGMMLNGVPLNDPESHQVYWVDHPDVLSSASSVQVQRGIGTTLFGASAFGGRVDVITSPTAATPGLELAAGYGTFTDGSFSQPTRTYRAAYATGPILDDRLELAVRYSRIDSEGYRVQSGVEHDAFALSALHRGGSVSNKIDILYGNEVSQSAWDGVSPNAPVSDSDLAAQPCYDVDLDDRDERRCNRYNIYPNNVDDFRQVIGSVTTEAPFGDVVLSNTAYYVNGRGFFEQYELGEDMADYGVGPVVSGPDTIDTFDVVRRRWLDNHYFGLLPQLRAPIAGGRATFGLGVRIYEASHFGELIDTSVDVGAEPEQRYYGFKTDKTSFEAYAGYERPIGSRTVLSLALQYQGHRYDFVQSNRWQQFAGYAFEANHDFLSPRAGLRHALSSDISVFGTVSFAEREPSQSDYIDGDDPGGVPAYENADWYSTGLDDPVVKPEKVLNTEVGAAFTRRAWNVRVALYQLDFRDELIPIDGGRVFEEGRLERANADRTRHRGVEVEAAVRPGARWSVSGNVSLAQHRFVNHEISAYWLDDYAGGLLELDGQTIPRSPTVLGNARVAYERPAGSLAATLQHVGKQYVDGENTESLAIDAFTLVNLHGRLELGSVLDLPRAFSLEARVNNVFDTLYETFGYSYYDDFPARPIAFYWPGATRSVHVSVRTVL